MPKKKAGRQQDREAGAGQEDGREAAQRLTARPTRAGSDLITRLGSLVRLTRQGASRRLSPRSLAAA
ncbi:hypothetical protein [Streptomyces sp. NPDC048200]|uniref:hypothetical protein n=1 Tax=Streptomyces sp. NPDC048200 TaxID=3365512 RepID=UPI003718A327